MPYSGHISVQLLMRILPSLYCPGCYLPVKVLGLGVTHDSAKISIEELEIKQDIYAANYPGLDNETFTVGMKDTIFQAAPEQYYEALVQL